MIDRQSAVVAGGRVSLDAEKETDVVSRSLRVTCMLWVSLLLAGSGCTILCPDRQVIHPAKSLSTIQPWDLAALSRGTDLVATLLGQLAGARQSPEISPEIQKLLHPLYRHHLARRYLTPVESLDGPDLLEEVALDLLGRLLPEED